MKKTMFVLVAIVLLSGCSALTLTKVESKYGRPARVEIECVAGAGCDEDTYYKDRYAVKYIYWFYYRMANPVLAPWDRQEWCFEYKADRNGKVTSHAEYIEQQSRLKSGRTPIQSRDGKLPGVE